MLLMDNKPIISPKHKPVAIGSVLIDESAVIHESARVNIDFYNFHNNFINFKIFKSLEIM